MSICGRAVTSPFNGLGGNRPRGFHLYRSWQVVLRDLQDVFSARRKLGQVSRGNLFWQPTVSWDCGNVCMFSKEQIWFQWSSDEAHASCASCLPQARPRAGSAYTETWQGLCQGFLMLWWAMGAFLGNRRKPCWQFITSLSRRLMKIHSAVLVPAVTFLSSMTHSSNNSTGLCVSHLHITCTDLQVQRCMCPGLYLNMLLIMGKLKLNSLQSHLLHKKAESQKMSSFTPCSLYLVTLIFAEEYYVWSDIFHYLEQNLH